MQNLMRVSEAAKALSVSEKKVWAMVASREIDVVRIGRSVRLPASAVEAVIKHGTTPARPEHY